MSEEFELPETPETPESRKERRVGLVIASIAVVLAIVTHLGNEIHQDEILAHVDAADQYAYYQAKKEGRTQLELQSDTTRLSYDGLSTSGKASADQLLAKYAGDISRDTKLGDAIKAKGDDLLAESERLAKKASVLDIGEIALQISVVLCSITILTEQGLFARLGISVALAGVAVAGWALFAMS